MENTGTLNRSQVYGGRGVEPEPFLIRAWQVHCKHVNVRSVTEIFVIIRKPLQEPKGSMYLIIGYVGIR